MTYTLHQTDNVKHIEEQQYAIGDAIGFTKFTSCIGVMALTSDGKIKAAHLVLVGKGDAVFDEAAAHAVADLFTGCKPDSAVIVGHHSTWAGSVDKAYGTLKTLLHGKLGTVHEVEKGDGVYGGRTQGGKIEVTG